MDPDIADVKKDIKTVEDCIRTLNREMGEVLGELRAIKWLLGGGLLAAILLQYLT